MYCEIKGVIVLDSDWKKLYSKYYNPGSDLNNALGQDLLEKQLKSKLSKFVLKNKENEVVLIDSLTIVLKQVNNITVFLLGNNDENEIFMASVLDILVEAMELVYRGELERNQILGEFELLMLCIDETFEDGNILAFDAQSIAEKVVMREMNEKVQVKNTTKDSLFARALQNAKSAMSKTIARK